MNRYILLVLTVFFLLEGVTAQDCDELSDKAYTQALSKIENTKNKESKINQLENLLLDYPSGLQAQFELAYAYFESNSGIQNPNYSQAKTAFEDLYQQCSSFNVSVNYYLGLIAYGEGNLQESVNYFTEFLKFKTNSYDLKHADKQNDTEAALPIIKQELRLQNQDNQTVFDVKKPFLMANVSTRKSEYLPMLSPDNSLLFYTRKYYKKTRDDLVGREVEEFTESKLVALDSLVFDRGEKMAPPFNLGDNFGGISLSANNKEMYITVCSPDKKGYKNCDIFYSRYTIIDTLNGKMKRGWTNLVNLGEAINSNDSWESQPSLSPDGKTLFFARYGFETKETDIYYSEKDSTGKWQLAKAIPGKINTDGHDKAPFLHQDGQTLYFSSTGHNSVGGFDIYKANKLPDGSWGKPVNLGSPINTAADEHGLIVSTDGKYAVYASDAEETSQFELYACELKLSLKPNEVLFVKGKLEGVTGTSKVEIKDANGALIQTATLDTLDGDYAAIIPINKINTDLIIRATNANDDFDSRIIQQTKGSSILNAPSMDLLPITRNKAYRLNDVVFDFDSYELTERSKQILNEFYLFAAKRTEYKIHIQGHTDNFGSEEKNTLLSTNRAKAVIAYLVEKGIKASRFSYEGFGALKPVSDNTTEEGRAKNRRTEFVLR